MAITNSRRMAGVGALLRRILSNYLLIVLAATVVFGALASPYFLTGRNIANVVSFSAIVSVMAVGQFLVICVGGIDLSVGSIAALTTVVAAVMLQAGYSVALAVIVALLVAVACGAINGFIVVRLHVTALIATLAMMNIAVGAAYMVQAGSLISISNNDFINFFSGSLGSIATPVIIFVAITGAFAFVMRWTTFGRRLYAIGGNAEAARLSGLAVGQSVFLAYTLCALLAGIAGLILAAQLTQGSSLLAANYNLDSITAVVVGGASLFGGTGDPIGAVIGGLVVAAIANIMNLLGIPSEPQYVVKGVVLLLAVFFITGDGAHIARSIVSGIRGKTSLPIPAAPPSGALGGTDQSAGETAVEVGHHDDFRGN